MLIKKKTICKLVADVADFMHSVTRSILTLTKVLNQWQKRAYKAVKNNICSDIAKPDLNQHIGYKKGLELEFSLSSR